MTKDAKKALLEKRIAVIEGRGKCKGTYSVLNKLYRRLTKENF